MHSGKCLFPKPRHSLMSIVLCRFILKIWLMAGSDFLRFGTAKQHQDSKLAALIFMRNQVSFLHIYPRNKLFESVAILIIFQISFLFRSHPKNGTYTLSIVSLMILFIEWICCNGILIVEIFEMPSIRLRPTWQKLVVCFLGPRVIMFRKLLLILWCDKYIVRTRHRTRFY